MKIAKLMSELNKEFEAVETEQKKHRKKLKKYRKKLGKKNIDNVMKKRNKSNDN